MSAKIKIDLEERLKSGSMVEVEIGSGPKRRTPSVITIDRLDMNSVDIVADIERGLGFLPDACLDRLYCRSVLEHIDNFEGLLREMLRVLKDSGRAHIFVPHFSNPYYYSDYTHRRHFGLYSFYYFVNPDKQLKRKVPVFYTDIRLEICSLRLVFKTPFWISRHLWKVIGFFVNSCKGMQEFYELHLFNWFPCHGIEIIFKKDLAEAESL